LNVVVSVLAVGYGLWLKKIVDQQLKMKDAVIGSLEAVIRTKEAEVSRPGGESAPAVATAYLTMKEFANPTPTTREARHLQALPSSELLTAKVMLDILY
jgi:hypothetical protein